MTSSTSPNPSPASTFPVRPYVPRHKNFPYTPFDLQPSDPTPDSSFYSAPRFVTHIDDHAINLLRVYYKSILPAPSLAKATTLSVPPPLTRPRVLDLCSSWVSHYPVELETAAKKGEDIGLQIAGLGMNAAELGANPLFGGKGEGKRWMVKDSNVDAEIPGLDVLFGGSNGTAGGSGGRSGDGSANEEGITTTTLTVSIDYLTQPVLVLQSLLSKTKEGGSVHLAISNRCFPTKAVGRWLRIDEEERLQMVGDYLWFAGWREVEIVQLSDGRLETKEGEEESDQAGNMGRFMSLMGLGGFGGRCDPLWVVRGRKVAEGEGEGKGRM